MLKKLKKMFLLTALLYTPWLHADTLTMVGADWCPYVCTQPDEPQKLANNPGLIVDIMKESFPAPKYDLKHLAPAWEEAIEAVRSGEAHALLGVFKSDVPDFVFPQNAIVNSQSCFYVNAETDWMYDEVSSLTDISLGVMSGYSYDEALDNYIAQHKSEPERVQMMTSVDGLQQMIDQVAEGKLTAFIDDQFVVQHLLEKNALSDSIQQVGCVPSKPLYVAFSPALKVSESYAEQLSATIKALRENGKLFHILRQYQLLETFWNQWDWEELTAEEQTQWGILGWDQASWQEEIEAPASEEKEWQALTPEEQAAAEKLGYTSNYWDGI